MTAACSCNRFSHLVCEEGVELDTFYPSPGRRFLIILHTIRDSLCAVVVIPSAFPSRPFIRLTCSPIAAGEYPPADVTQRAMPFESSAEHTHIHQAKTPAEARRRRGC